jgi:hypothetical protein
MCLVFKARAATKDVDAIFAPIPEIREAAAAVASRFGVPEDWLNDAAKGFFLSDSPRIPVLKFPHLRVWAPAPEYMLAMKCVSARFDSHDRTDVAFLIRHLGLECPEEVLEIVCRYYPRERVPPKAGFLVEELFEEREHQPRPTEQHRPSHGERKGGKLPAAFHPRRLKLLWHVFP